MDTRLEPTPILSCLHLMELFPVHIVIKGPRKLPDVIKIFKLMTALIIIVDALDLACRNSHATMVEQLSAESFLSCHI